MVALTPIFSIRSSDPINTLMKSIRSTTRIVLLATTLSLGLAVTTGAFGRVLLQNRHATDKIDNGYTWFIIE